MARGVIYAMSTVVPGLVKLGRTEEDGFEDEMKRLEGNGYANIAGLRREHAILVDDVEEKMELLEEVFGSVRIPGTDLYAVDAGLVSRLLSSFRGETHLSRREGEEIRFLCSGWGVRPRQDGKTEWNAGNGKSHRQGRCVRHPRGNGNHHG